MTTQPDPIAAQRDRAVKRVARLLPVVAAARELIETAARPVGVGFVEDWIVVDRAAYLRLRQALREADGGERAQEGH